MNCVSSDGQDSSIVSDDRYDSNAPIIPVQDRKVHLKKVLGSAGLKKQLISIKPPQTTIHQIALRD